MTKEKKRFRTVLHGCFLAGVIVSWIHFLLKECDSIDSLCLRAFSNIKIILFRIYWWCRNNSGWGSIIGQVPKGFDECICISGCYIISLISLSCLCFTCIEHIIGNWNNWNLMMPISAHCHMSPLSLGLWRTEVWGRGFSLGNELLGQIFSRGSNQKV